MPTQFNSENRVELFNLEIEIEIKVSKISRDANGAGWGEFNTIPIVGQVSSTRLALPDLHHEGDIPDCFSNIAL